jgi:hypothetical protein
MALQQPPATFLSLGSSLAGTLFELPPSNEVVR